MTNCRVEKETNEFEHKAVEAEQFADEDRGEEELVLKRNVIVRHVMHGNKLEVPQGNTVIKFDFIGISEQFVDDVSDRNDSIDVIDIWQPIVESFLHGHVGLGGNKVLNLIAVTIVGMVDSLTDDAIDELYKEVEGKS